MKPLIAFAGAGALGLAALLVLQAMSPAQVPLPRPRPMERLAMAAGAPTVEERWPRPVETVRVTIPKAAVATVPPLPTLAPASVAAFPVAPVVEPETKKPPEEAAIEKDRRKARRERRAEYDICRGKGKRYTNGGRSWRCQR
jgi:hypothetical protein